ncbi:hypothetical protein HPP92_006522 [Vanilla planifolia]|uniref:Uncharacterized protein n=1 Tax=Vanilla planifolia TaxID=51239 RepID=A0A835RPT3_VANPL|nr:hypothetical protein HPP92_006522 [Vanilla planifolia]
MGDKQKLMGVVKHQGRAIVKLENNLERRAQRRIGIKSLGKGRRGGKQMGDGGAPRLDAERRMIVCCMTQGAYRWN